MENKTGKYFKYAVGEIILVVIGILIALQINNWNEVRKNSQNETKFLEGILNDIDEQKVLCNVQIDSESDKEKWVLRSLRIIKKESFEHELDSLFWYISSLNHRKTFNVFNPTFEELKSTGNFNLIKNKNLKSSIVLFYQNLELKAQVIANNNLNLDNIYKTYVLNNSIGFYHNSQNKIQVNWQHKPSQILRLSRNLNMRKMLTFANLDKANEILLEANEIELEIKEYLKTK